MAKKEPVGTVRYWSNGPMIKAHENLRINGESVKSGWIPLPSNPQLERLGRQGDEDAREILRHKDPIDGELYLDHELDEFDDEMGGHKKYNAGSFKEFGGYSSKAYYSYKETFAKAWMKKKLDLEEEIANRINRQSEINARDKDTVDVTTEEKRQIRREVTEEYRSVEDHFDIKDAERVVEITGRVKSDMVKGVDFEGEDKKVWDKVNADIATLTGDYMKIEEAITVRDVAIDDLKEQFPENWGLNETFKKKAGEQYTKYLDKYKEEIKRDYLSKLQSEYSLEIDGEIDDYYDKLVTIESEEDRFDLKTLTEIRFGLLYNKTVEGEWNNNSIEALRAMEQVMKTMPSGHFTTNEELRYIGNKDYSGADGYAWYSPGDKAINLSDDAVNSVSIIGNLTDATELKSVISHEIGHAVSAKFRKIRNIEYKRFGALAGWSFKQEQLQATGDDKDIPRMGSNSDTPLLTNYAHKSPEECFAEYYSIYNLNKEGIDKWLKSKNTDDISKISAVHVEGGLKEAKIAKTFSSGSERQKEVTSYADNRFGESWGELIETRSFNPSDLGEMSRVTGYDVEIVKSNKRRFSEGYYGAVVPPVIVTDGKDHQVISDPSTVKAARISRQSVPGITIPQANYRAMKKGGYSDLEIASAVRNKASDSGKTIMWGKPEVMAVKKGFTYRSTFIPSEKLAKNYNLFTQMARIYNSEDLKKALTELFGLEKSKHYKQITVQGKNGTYTRRQLVGSNYEHIKDMVDQRMKDKPAYVKERMGDFTRSGFKTTRLTEKYLLKFPTFSDLTKELKGSVKSIILADDKGRVKLYPSNWKKGYILGKNNRQTGETRAVKPDIKGVKNVYVNPNELEKLEIEAEVEFNESVKQEARDLAIQASHQEWEGDIEDKKLYFTGSKELDKIYKYIDDGKD